MRSPVQPRHCAGIGPGGSAPERMVPIRFASQHWGWLRAVLAVCLLFAVGATGTEELRFQSRHTRRSSRAKQWRVGNASRGQVRCARQDHCIAEAADGLQWGAIEIADCTDCAGCANGEQRDFGRGSSLPVASYTAPLPDFDVYGLPPEEPAGIPLVRAGSSRGRAPPAPAASFL